jgi:hypothetical protein
MSLEPCRRLPNPKTANFPTAAVGSPVGGPQTERQQPGKVALRRAKTMTKPDKSCQPGWPCFTTKAAPREPRLRLAHLEKRANFCQPGSWDAAGKSSQCQRATLDMECGLLLAGWHSVPTSSRFRRSLCPWPWSLEPCHRLPPAATGCQIRRGREVSGQRWPRYGRYEFSRLEVDTVEDMIIQRIGASMVGRRL